MIQLPQLKILLSSHVDLSRGTLKKAQSFLSLLEKIDRLAFKTTWTTLELLPKYFVV